VSGLRNSILAKAIVLLFKNDKFIDAVNKLVNRKKGSVSQSTKSSGFAPVPDDVVMILRVSLGDNGISEQRHLVRRLIESSQATVTVRTLTTAAAVSRSHWSRWKAAY